jgi:hypothetical protein
MYVPEAVGVPLIVHVALPVVGPDGFIVADIPATPEPEHE